MKKLILSVATILWMITYSGCIKDDDCNPKTVQSEQAAIAAFASSNGITGTTHGTGLYYQITNQGSGPAPTLNSIVSVKYTGKLMNGAIFEQKTTTPVQISLGQVILGWQIGLQLLNKGGTIKLIIPSSMAYGCRPSGPIPAHSILYFEIELVDVI